MSHYTPQNTFEKETLIHLAAIISMDDIGTVQQRIEYESQYLILRYGKDPEHECVPSYYKEMYNCDEHKDALDLDVWLTMSMLYVSQNIDKLKKDLKKGNTQCS